MGFFYVKNMKKERGLQQDFMLNEERLDALRRSPSYDLGCQNGIRLTLLVEQFGNNSIVFMRELEEDGRERFRGTIGKSEIDAVYSLGFNVHAAYMHHTRPSGK